jgi:hypothetical protein
MRKSLIVAVLLLAGLTLVAGSKSVASAPAAITTPQIVATGRLLNQSAPFSKTIYTPGVSGIYRLSAYGTMVAADPDSTSVWWYNFGWTDASGTQATSNVLLGLGNRTGMFLLGAESNTMGGLTMTFQANKGTPITHNAIQSGSPDASQYSVYYTLERLQ